jgi:uncharacterized protein YecE (DUF72 family)
MKRLHDIADAVARFWEPLEPLRLSHRLGPVLWQLPENFERDDDLLAAALDRLPPADHCFEFRHPSWFAAPVRELLDDRGASLAIGDDKRRPLPEARPVGRCSPTSVCTMAPAGAVAITPTQSSTSGGVGSPPGARDARSSST